MTHQVVVEVAIEWPFLVYETYSFSISDACNNLGTHWGEASRKKKS